MFFQFFKGIYPDNLPSGEYVVGIFEDPSDDNTVTHLESNFGNIRLPIEEREPGPRLMFNRITNINGFQILSKSHSLNETYHFYWGEWNKTGKISHGTQGHIFDLSGRPHIWLPCTNCESQGYRYDDPLMGLIMGSPTYSPNTDFAKSYKVKKAYAWTHIDGIVVGQGANGGIVIEYQNQVKLLHEDNGEYVQFKKKGDKLAIAWSVFKVHKAAICWLDVSEINALADYPVIITPPPLDDVDDVIIPEPPKVTMKLPKFVQQNVIDLYNAHKELSHSTNEDERRELTRMVAEQCHFDDPQPKGKRWGHKSSTPSNPPSKDAIAKEEGSFLLGWDVFNGKTRLPQVSGNSIDISDQHFIPVNPVNHLGHNEVESDPPIDETDNPSDDTNVTEDSENEVISRLNRIEKKLDELLNSTLVKWLLKK